MRQLNREELLQLDKATLVEIILQLQAQVQTLNQRMAELEARLNQNSRNSSKPPSSDGLTKPKPKSLRQQGIRKSGGQPGHKGHTLKQVAAPDHVVTIPAIVCTGGCAAEIALAPVEAYLRRQVFDLPQPKLEITEYRAEIKLCPRCGKRIRGEFPDGVSAPTQYGPRVNALLVYLNQQQLLPAGRTVQLMQDIFGQKVSQGTLFHAINSCHDQLGGVEDAIKKQLRQGTIVHADESGLRTQGRLHWLHVACTERLTFYGVHARRGRIAMDEFNILPGFAGRLIHDFWRPYWAYNCEHGLCNAHHLRELIFLFEEHQQAWAGKMIEILLDLHRLTSKRKEKPSVPLADEEKAPFLERYRAIIDQGWQENPLPDPVPKKRGRRKKTKAQNLLVRLGEHESSVLAFVHDLNVPFTNNLGEQDIRMIKVRMKVSGCFRTIEGARQFARIRGYLSSARKNGINLLDAMTQVFQGTPFIPSG